MASSSLSTNVSSAISTFTFATPLKLDRSNYNIWKSQILSAIRANDLEGFLDGSRTCPNQLLPGESTSTEAAIISENSAYTAWKRQDQMILSWLLSSISVEILSIVNQGPRAAYVTTSEGVVDQGWYLDSGATHHLTNNVQNLVEGQEGGNFAGTGDC